jgi:predicted transcriptional regulator
MARKRQVRDPIEDIRDTMKNLLALELFRANVAQVDIAKKLRMDINAVNAFLKGIKKDK